MNDLQEARVARLAECHSNKRRVTTNTPAPHSNISSPALEYWEDELSAKDPATKEVYLTNFSKFLEFTHKTPDELLTQRQEDQINQDRKIQRRLESQLIKFIAVKREEGYSSATLQIYYASVRSFFEIHYYPLIMRKGDYPKGESIGVRSATRETILKAVESNTGRHKKQLHAIILFLKDTGMRISDARLLNYGAIRETLECGDKVIPITIVTEKVKTIQKTFIGEEAIHAIKEYIESRRKGTPKVPPETVTDKSPLFRTNQPNNIKRIGRTSFSSMIRNAFLRVNEANLSPHSLRKYLQTSLEEARVNANWIDQIIGHELINCRGAYSKPTDEQLKEAYKQAYPFIKVYPDPTNQKPATPAPENPTTTQQTATPNQPIDLVTQLLQKGYEVTMKQDGTMAFRIPSA